MQIPDRPGYILWDITYHCPLRCTHCYSESGRRPARQLSLDDNLRVADAIISLAPDSVGLGGGEALVVPGIFEIVERITSAGIEVYLYTGGWPLRERAMEEILRLRPQVHMSVDGATAEVHDLIRGRAGSYDRAMKALRLLDDAAGTARSRGEPALKFGIDSTVLRSSYDQMELFCTDVAPRFPELGFLYLSAVVPSGLANRQSFVDRELLTDEQAARLASPELTERLKALAPPGLELAVSDNWGTSMRPDRIAAGNFFAAMAVEPDGAVRAMCIYEGVVGNILDDDPLLLWKRAVARWHDPYVVETLGPVRTMREWAEAARRIDRRFGTAEDLARIDRRPEFAAALPLRGRS
ncbi:radical SAM protein [Streptomyces spectabilis]|uniref:Radical SAM protein n=1 Tax=Streptomyces spectabilis TaxID=68270 RepID=A0A5P2XFQ7_STRST|nr:radical SAM protein [Streptomyces spectabilis]MBB5102027.1 hypothetical protein [Streptomyces spectabilis]MCI3907078.1 radical SAM protein [Streptomyces spectabilis]QEV63847.1 radical SAM protein [Streptomyces spectabilis]GGV35761.1 hypothetical protein GCM10010245_57350 [Streptomyces spectabilis]